MSSDIRDSDVETVRISVMKALTQVTQNDETVSVNRHSIFEMACRSAGASYGAGQYNSGNTTLENLVFQKLVGLGHVIQGENNQINITYQGKTSPEYQY
jgi:hypothetical protein